MADYITRIRTIDGDKQIDYNALANLPDLSLVGEVKILDSSDNVEARTVTLTDNEDQPIAPITNANAVAYDENSTVKVILDRFANGIILTEGIDYGSGDPGSGVLGQLYFKKVT